MPLIKIDNARFAELVKAQFRHAIQSHIDATAQAQEYDSGANLAGYVSSTIPIWRAQAEAFVAWRDLVWITVFERLAMVEAGLEPPPESAQELIDILPVIEWPAIQPPDDEPEDEPSDL